MLNVKEAIRFCDTSRKLLRGQCATLRALIKDGASHFGNNVASSANTLEMHYRKSVIVGIEISLLTAEQAALLMYNLGGLAKLMRATNRLALTHQEVAELLMTVSEKEVTGDPIAPER